MAGRSMGVAGAGGRLLLAAVLADRRARREAYANTYYAAAVKSMLTSWHDFFFVSFDSGGFVTRGQAAGGPLGPGDQRQIFGFNG